MQANDNTNLKKDQENHANKAHLQVRKALKETARQLGLDIESAWNQATKDTGKNLKYAIDRLHALIRAVGYALCQVRQQRASGCVNFMTSGCMLAAAAGISDRQGQTLRAKLRDEGKIHYATHAQPQEGKAAIDGLTMSVSLSHQPPRVAPESYGETVRISFARDRAEHRGSGMMLRELREKAQLGTDDESLKLVLIKLVQMAINPCQAVLGLEAHSAAQSGEKHNTPKQAKEERAEDKRAEERETTPTSTAAPGLPSHIKNSLQTLFAPEKIEKTAQTRLPRTNTRAIILSETERAESEEARVQRLFREIELEEQSLRLAQRPGATPTKEARETNFRAVS